MSFAQLDDVLAEVEALGKLFVDAGYRLFLVGGVVRDQWLDAPLDASSDIDLTTNALPAEIKRIVASFAETLWIQGERFGTIGLRAGGRDYEITTHRAESYTADSRKPTVSFGDNIDVDLSRRDFTVNAMAIELPDGALVDPYGGAVDLEAGLLRTPLSADISFADDPLRMLRAARFAARFALAPAEEIVESAGRLRERIRIVAIERIGVEVRRLLGLTNADVGLRFLADAGLLAEVLGYSNHELVPQIQPRLGLAIDAVAKLDPDWHLRLAALGLMVFDDGDGVQAMCGRLRLSRDDERMVTHTSRAALAVTTSDASSPELRRWLARCDDPDAALRVAAVIGDTTDHVERFAQSLDALGAQEETTDLVFLNGETIMSELGITPGPAVGEATAFLHESYYRSGPLAESEQLRLLQSWWDDRATNT